MHSAYVKTEREQCQAKS